MSQRLAFRVRGRFAAQYLALCTTLLIAACQAPPPPPVPDPGPPARPVPPLGAAVGTYIPPADPETGKRVTPNTDIDHNETIWHFRAAFNVAALNCTSPAYNGIVDYYNAYLTGLKQPLGRVNRELDQKFKAAFPAVNGLRVRDTHTTSLYNYFALPPTSEGLCDLIFANAPQAASLTEDELYGFSSRMLTEIDDIFIKFYEDYEDYMRRLAEWEALYGLRGEVIVGGDALYADPPKPAIETGRTFDEAPRDPADPMDAPRLPGEEAPADEAAPEAPAAPGFRTTPEADFAPGGEAQPAPLDTQTPPTALTEPAAETPPGALPPGYRPSVGDVR